MKKSRLINFRLPFALALAVACGIGLSFALAYFNVDLFYVITAVPFAAVIFILCALVSRRTRTVVNCALVLVIFVFGAVYSAVNLYVYESSPSEFESLTRVSGRVEDVEKTRSGDVCFILSDLSVNGKPLGGKAIVYADGEGGGYAEVGYTVSALCSIEKCDLFSYGSLNYNATDGIRYSCRMYGAVDSQYGFSLFGSIKSSVSGMLYDNLPYETASVACAMLTGDTRLMDEQTLSSFRYGGIAHIFAVSGLHIGIVYSVLSFVLSKLRVNRYLSAALKISAIIFYAGVCGFTPSSVRAVVMCAVAALSKLQFLKYDLLNSLSVAAIILLIINPYNLFDVGFILSVSAMLGIVFLAPNLRRLTHRLPEKLKGSLSAAVSAQAATFPAQMLSFGYVSAAGLVLNVLVLPVLSALYGLLFTSTVIALVIPPASAMLKYVCLPLEGFINLFVGLGFENAVISGFGGWWTAVLPAIFLAALSDKFNLKIVVRAAICCVCALSFTLFAVFSGRVFGDGALIITDAYYGGSMTLIRTSSGNILVVTQGTDKTRITSFIDRHGAKDVNDVIILGDDEAVAYCLQVGLEDKNVYVCSSLINLPDVGNVSYESGFSLYGADCTFLSPNVVKVEVSGVECAILWGQPQNGVQADLIISQQVFQDLNGSTVCYGGYGGDYNVYTQGCLQFSADNGTISMKGLPPINR
ncbi:MAG: ComEC/Rec2 family competence protein [Candidatus Coproplasma sp.]